MVKKRKIHLRPTDIAWQAFQAGAALLHRGYDTDVDYLSTEFKAWWKRHPQTTPDGELKGEM